MPPSFNGGLPCANAADAAIASTDARTPERIRFMEASLRTGRIACGVGFVAAIMPKQRKPSTKSTKVGGFVVGRAHFAEISAVEGIELTPVMEKRASEADQKGLSA